MSSTAWAPPWLLTLPTMLLGGIYLVWLLDGVMLRAAAGSSPAGGTLGRPLRTLAAELGRQHIATEAPDTVGRYSAPALYLGLALLGLALIPVDHGQVLLKTPVGIVVWGAVESLTVVAVFLHGWSQNSLFPLLGGYRYVAMGLAAMLLSMFVLIGTALPAQSLSLTAIAASQESLWNVVRQPLGLPLFLLLGLTLALRAPMNFGDSADLGGGTAVEDSGPLHAAWIIARAAMLVSFAAVAATVFLGGYLGPLLPGPAWLVMKTAAVLTLLVAASHALAQPDPSRALTVVWVVLLPLAFGNLALAGLGSLA